MDAAGKVWAVGWDRDYDAPGRPVSSLVVHFNGTSWTCQATPNPANRNTLMDVVALANGEVFAGRGGPGHFRRGHHATVAHAAPDGRDLVVADRAQRARPDPRPAAVSRGCTSTSVWSVGYYSSPSSGLYEPLLVH